jgi:hypothetical protein
MQDAGNENASRFAPKEHDMLALFHAAQAGANVIAGAARCRIVGQSTATRFKLGDIAVWSSPHVRKV